MRIDCFYIAINVMLRKKVQGNEGSALVLYVPGNSILTNRNLNGKKFSIKGFMCQVYRF